MMHRLLGFGCVLVCAIIAALLAQLHLLLGVAAAFAAQLFTAGLAQSYAMSRARREVTRAAVALADAETELQLLREFRQRVFEQTDARTSASADVSGYVLMCVKKLRAERDIYRQRAGNGKGASV